MKSLAQLFGALGVIFIFFGAISSIAFFQGSFQLIGFGQLAIGLIGVGIFLFYFFGAALQTLSRGKEAIFGIIGGVLILFILVGANVVAHSKLGERKWDTTANKLHSLSPDSVQLLKNLPSDVSVVGFLPTHHQEMGRLNDLVKKYTYFSDRIKYRIVDPDKEPQTLKVYEANPEEIIVRNDTTKKMVRLTALSEQELSTAIKRVMAKESKVVYLLQGHNEGDLEEPKDSRATAGLYILKVLLENEGFQVRPLMLANSTEVPKDASVVYAWGAQRPIPNKEVEILTQYVERGGNLIIGQDPLLAPTKDKLIAAGWEPLLSKVGLQLKPAVVLEHQLQLLRGKVINAKLAISDFGNHPIVEKLGGQGIAEFFISQPVDVLPEYKGTAKIEMLVSSGNNSWAEADIGSIFVTQKPSNQGSAGGGVPLAQLAELPVSDKIKDALSKVGKVAVFGDADFGQNGLIQSGYNRDLLLNSTNYMAGEETTMTIRPKMWTTSTLNVQPDDMRLISYASIFVIPQLILILGVMIWLFRRHRSVTA